MLASGSGWAEFDVHGTAQQGRSESGKVATLVGLDSPEFDLIFFPHLKPQKGLASKVIGIHSSDARHSVSCIGEAVGWFDPYGDLDVYIYGGNHGAQRGKTQLGAYPGCSNQDHWQSLRVFESLLDYTPAQIARAPRQDTPASLSESDLRYQKRMFWDTDPANSSVQ